MTTDALLNCLAAVFTQITGAVFLFLLSDNWRFSRRTSILSFAGVSFLSTLFQACCFYFLDLNTGNLFAMLGDVASLILAPILIRWRNGRLLFSMAATYSFTFSTVMFSHLLFPQITPEHLAVRFTITALFFLFLHRWFAPCLRSTFRIDVSGWYGLALIPLLFGLIFFTLTAGKFSTPSSPLNRPFSAIPNATIHYVLLIFPPCTYLVLYHFFDALLQRYAGFREHATLSARLTTLETRQRNETQRLDTQQHFLESLERDLHHIDSLICGGQLEAALGVSEGIERSAATLMETGGRRRFTHVPILDAVLSDYAAAAGVSGVAFSIQFVLPDESGLDTTALAVVLSNALENAITACNAQPTGRPKEIRLTTASTPAQFFLLLENTCDTPVAFDHDGYPVSNRPGHGYGTRSIAAFVQQYNGFLRYQWRDGRFSVQFLLDLAK